MSYRQVPIEENTLVAEAKGWWATAPLFTATILVTSAFLYLISFLKDTVQMFGNIPDYTIAGFEIYRLILFPFTNYTILELVLGLAFTLISIADLERHYGFFKILLYFLMKNIEIGIMYCIPLLLISLFWEKAASFPSYGVFAFLYAIRVKEMLENPEQTFVIFNGFPIMKANIYLIILTITCLIISEFIRIDIFFGVLSGYLAKYTEPLYQTILNENTINNIEKLPILSLLVVQPRFVSVSGANLKTDEHKHKDGKEKDNQSQIDLKDGKGEHEHDKDKPVGSDENYDQLDHEDDEGHKKIHIGQ